MMASLLLIFALVLGIAGGFLLYYDRTQRVADAQRDTASQHDRKGWDTWEDQDAPSHARPETKGETEEDAEDAAGSEAVTDSESEGGAEDHPGFAAKYSPSPDVESDSSSATSSGRHHRAAGESGRSGDDRASEDSASDANASDEARANDSEAVSDNGVVKGSAATAATAANATASTAGPNDAHATGSDSTSSSDNVGSASNTGSAGSAGSAARANTAGSTEETSEAGAETESGAADSLEEAGQEGTEEQPEGHAKPKPVGRPRPLIPGTIRRERKNWAETRGFEYMKSDQYLVDEWTRGVASSGAAPKDIVAGNVYGHEMLLMDIDGVNVMAMRTGAASDVVIDFQRFGSQEAEMSEDLLMAMSIEGFDVYSSDRGVTERMVDERVRIALQRMPEVVSALWLETEWVLAQTTKHSRTADWEAMLPPLALLADASRVLPPRSSSVHTIHLEDLDPAREIPAAPVVDAVGGTAAAGQPEFSRPVIQRPEEPLDMPSRTYSETRGPVEHTAIGADEVDAIADGNERPTPDSGTARLPRQQFGEASIFGDASGDASGDGLDAASQDVSGSAAGWENDDKDRGDDSEPQQGE
ncbi:MULTISPECIES: hypothetical protein [unclassified Corynebacterium]|uniref:hypothetical protein n=1 Tax=Corynebacterium TaxID=1716 RepID=UPI00254A4EC3|nr:MULTISPECIES: hypothetical protein [unclassified Corynebacterium]MDK8467503.1 hypothetical protein [Corynebacterium sp. MSK130]MDK8476454.1 hypothetical protein [Corynebacterium sp. MSK310]MDK8491957.1 hypothetical protein [Corynebacterium sp. MSK175]MDK8647992.1 hypothetical protein [Corynebacterium sp. MSK082]MDK8672703.1 hypothetical protein [Corynebacterium sp. MSK189]